MVGLARAFFMNLLVVVTLCVIAGGALSAMNFHFNVRDMLVAAGVSAVASEVALVPLIVVRGKSQAVASQAGLIGTVLHTMLSAGLAMGVSAILRMGQPLMYWTLLFYWGTLISVAFAGVRAVKAAPIHSNS